MIIKKLLVIGIMVIGLGSFAQELTCEDFKTGTFYIPLNKNESKKYTLISTSESGSKIQKISEKRDSTLTKYIIVRQKDTQIEWKNGLDIGVPEYEKLEWIDECTYRLTYDESKSEMNDYKKSINENQGIIVRKLRIVEKCMDYEAIMTTNDGRKIIQKGVICKE